MGLSGVIPPAVTALENPKHRPHFSCKEVVLGSRQSRTGAAPPRVIPTLGDQRAETLEVRKALHMTISLFPSKMTDLMQELPQVVAQGPLVPVASPGRCHGVAARGERGFNTERLCWGPSCCCAGTKGVLRKPGAVRQGLERVKGNGEL